jgi:hypothetical protein
MPHFDGVTIETGPFEPSPSGKDISCSCSRKAVILVREPHTRFFSPRCEVCLLAALQGRPFGVIPGTEAHQIHER